MDFIVGDEIILKRIPVGNEGFVKHEVGNILFILWRFLFIRPFGTRNLTIRFASEKHLTEY